MTARPSPTQLARLLRDTADLIDRHGPRALDMAPLLAARGWPTTTLGDGTGSRTDTDTTSTETAALTNTRFDGIDTRLDAAWLTTWRAATACAALVTTVTAHAAPDTEHNGRATTHTGAGTCGACNKWVTGSSNDRLRAGWCNACRVSYQRWRDRTGHTDRAAFTRWRRAELTPTNPEHHDPTDGHGGHGP